MGLTKSLCCHRLCFTNVDSCPHCGRAFPPGTLKAKAVAEDKAFDRKAHVLFLAAFALAAVLVLVPHQSYFRGTPKPIDNGHLQYVPAIHTRN
jgi:hypothetical protein